MNIIIAGIGGQGTILASNVICDVLLEQGYDVKKSEIHGMSQRGGSVISHVRYSKTGKVYSPMVSLKDADIVLSFHPNETRRYAHLAKDNAKVIELNDEDKKKLANPRSLNMYGVGILSKLLNIEEKYWTATIKKLLKPKIQEENLSAFALGRQAS